MYRQIYLDAPNLGELEKYYLNKAIDSGYISTIGPYVREFEDKFAGYIGVNGAVSVQSGTAAIHIALHELGIGQDDEVIVPALTFVATVNPILYVGAKPTFVDVDIYTWDIDPKEIEKAITKKTKAIVPVHLYGNPCNIEEIMNIAKAYNLYVIEDATESLGAKYSAKGGSASDGKGKYTGTFGDLGCFSFNGNKTITTGGGGMVVGNDVNRLKHIKFLVNQARDEAKEYYHSEIGFNYRMTNIEAAIGLSQMEKLDKFLAKKRKFNEIYREELESLDFIRFQREYVGTESFWWLQCIIFEKDVNIITLQKELRDKGVPTRRIFMPIVEFPPYKKYKDRNYKNAYYIYEKGLCLPCSTLNSEREIYRVCQILKDTLLN